MLLIDLCFLKVLFINTSSFLDWQIARHLVSPWQQEMKWRRCDAVLSCFHTGSLSLCVHFHSVPSTWRILPHDRLNASHWPHLSAYTLQCSGGLWSVPHTPKHQAYFSHHCVQLLLWCFCTKFPRDHLVVCLDDWLFDGYKITFMCSFFSQAIMPHFHVFVFLQLWCVCAGVY